MNLRRYNLNLLVALDAILDCRSVTKASHHLGLSQPATSATLAKLRHMFADELLVVVGRELQLTPRAKELQPMLKDALGQVAGLLKRESFEPGSWFGEFTIATADYISLLLLPEFISSIEQHAPNLTIHFVNIHRELNEHLKHDKIHAIIAPLSVIRDPMLMSRKLFDDRFVCIYRGGDAPRSRDIDMETYLANRHVMFSMDQMDFQAGRARYLKDLDDLREMQTSTAAFPFYMALPFAVESTGHFALAQERLAIQLMSKLNITYTDPPMPIAKLEMALFWNPNMNNDPRHRWMRDQIASFGALVPPLAPLS